MSAKIARSRLTVGLLVLVGVLGAIAIIGFGARYLGGPGSDLPRDLADSPVNMVASVSPSTDPPTIPDFDRKVSIEKNNVAALQNCVSVNVGRFTEVGQASAYKAVEMICVSRLTPPQGEACRELYRRISESYVDAYFFKLGWPLPDHNYPGPPCTDA